MKRILALFDVLWLLYVLLMGNIMYWSTWVLTLGYIASYNKQEVTKILFGGKGE